jgi:hypothetical protein
MKITTRYNTTTYDFNGLVKDGEIEREPILNYKPRDCFKEVHNKKWKHGVVIAHRRAGKTFSAVAELLDRAYHAPPLPSGLPQQVLYTSPQLDQALQNSLPLFTTIGKEFIADINKGDSTITLINGARIIYCGAKTIEKVRGLYLTGWLSDEVQEPIERAYTDIIYPALADTDGWSLRIGTARTDDDYLLYNTYKYLKERHGDDPEWLFLKVGVNESQIYDEEKIAKIKEEFWNAGRAARKTAAQIQQGWNCEYEADFSFIDEGKPNVSAKFYFPLTNIFNNDKIKDTENGDLDTPAPNTVVLDIATGNGRDYTVGLFGSYKFDNNGSSIHVDNIKYDNTRNLTQWAEEFKEKGIKNVVLPFDAAQTNKETGLNLFDFFLKKGFKVFKIKRLLHKVQEEHAEWLLNNSTFDSKCVPALRELGKFEEWNPRHKLGQDIASAVCYAGQYFRKVDIKEMRASKIALETERNNYVFDQYDHLSPLGGGVF